MKQIWIKSFVLALILTPMVMIFGMPIWISIVIGAAILIIIEIRKID
jgi:hypothetical protein